MGLEIVRAVVYGWMAPYRTFSCKDQGEKGCPISTESDGGGCVVTGIVMTREPFAEALFRIPLLIHTAYLGPDCWQ
jgi:hypothetical protein